MTKLEEAIKTFDDFFLSHYTIQKPPWKATGMSGFTGRKWEIMVEVTGDSLEELTNKLYDATIDSRR